MKPCLDLVSRAQRDRSAGALEALVAAVQGDVFHLLCRQLGNEADAEDATQETFRQVIRTLPSLRDPAAFPGWIHRIALRAAAKAIHGRAARRRIVEDLSRNAPRSQEPAMSDAERRETRESVRSAVESLDDELRTTVILRYEQGLSYGEIAEAMECPEGTVGKRLHSAHERLRKALAGAGVAVGLALLESELAAEPRVPLPGRLSGALGQVVREEFRSRVRWKTPAIAVATILVALLAAWRIAGGRAEPVEGGGAATASAAPSAARADAAAEPRPAAADPTPESDPPPVAAPAESRVAGRVLDRLSGSPIAGARVILKLKDPDGFPAKQAGTAATNAAGEYSLPAPPGLYLIDARAPGYVPFENLHRVRRFLIESGGETAALLPDEIQLADGQKLEHDIPLEPGAVLRGTVTDENGRPLADCEVRVAKHDFTENEHNMSFSDGETDPHMKTGAQGRFEFDTLSAGSTVTVEVRHAGYAPRQSATALTSVPAEVTIALEPSRDIVGRVVDAAGLPVPGAELWVLYEGDRPGMAMPCMKAVNAQGRFELRDLKAGLSAVVAAAPGRWPAVVSVAGADRSDLVVTLPDAPDVLRGCVRDESGRELAGAVIEVICIGFGNGDLQGTYLPRAKNRGGMSHDGLSFLCMSMSRNSGMSATSGKDGRFEIGKLRLSAETRVRVSVKVEGYPMATSEVTSGAFLDVTMKK